MTSTVNERGRLELPSEIIAQLGLKPGDHVLIETRDGQCILRPVRCETGLRWEGNVLVHEGVGCDTAVSELHDERLNRLSGGKS